jgi:predicted nucleotidyltransferase
MNSIDKIQNRLHGELGAYINSCAFSRLGLLLTVVSRLPACLLNASRIRNSFASFAGSVPTASCSTNPARLDVPVYSGSNSHVISMMRHLEPLEEELHGAYVHGSLGSSEENRYSDFDALVILKDSVFRSSWKLSYLASRLSSLQHIMLDFDPLQHHGWFVLTESDLRYYCEAYFPAELFRHAKSLLQTSGTHLDLAVRNSERESKDVFNAVATAVISKTSGGRRPGNLFQLKSFLSEFMLLPALYLQAVNSNGIFKKFSYEVARKDFSAEEWKIMDEVSAMRMEWVHHNKNTTPAFLSLNLTARIVHNRRNSPAIPPDMGRHLTQDFYQRIHALAVSMHEKVM